MTDDKIKIGHFVIIQRQKYTKLFKFNNLTAQAALAKDQVLMKNINEHPYSTTFKMVPTTLHGKRIIDLEPCTDISSLKDEINITESGTDNRNVKINYDAQTLKADDIEKLRESGSSASEIVGTIIENSKSFSSKTEYSQDKYLRKKEKKYFEYLQIRRPTIRMLAEIMYRQDPEKILGLRIDSLSQLISYSNVCATGNFLLYESGTNGLVTAALLNAIGANTSGILLHLHQGNVPQKLALQALNLEKEQLDRCISANIYSILRQYYQRDGGIKRKHDDIADSETICASAKLPKVDGDNVENEMEVDQVNRDDNTGNGSEEANGTTQAAAKQNPNDESKDTNNKPTPPKWMLENERGCELLRENLDALIIVAKEHPVAIMNTLLPFVKPSRPIVIFQLSRDILMEAFIDLKSSGKVTGLKLTSNWLRMYQVLPNRTHPDVNMSGNSGFVLHGYTVRNCDTN